ncbi:hypothetical protein PGANDO_1339, partial [Porphyromonas gingivalis]
LVWLQRLVSEAVSVY